MGWREVLEEAAEDVDFGSLKHAGVAERLIAMPPSDRIALARELLAGTGKCVVDVDAHVAMTVRKAAMLGDEG